jgi:hypothetical protein
MYKRLLILCAGLFILNAGDSTFAQTPTITRIAANLQNPRGVAVLPDGRLIVGEAGTGFVADDPSTNTGKVSVFEDINGDGDYDDAGEITPILEHLPGYNILYQFNPGRDEIVGVGDVLTLEDGRVFFTLDNNFETISIVELTPSFERLDDLVERPGTLNAIAYDSIADVIYVAESTLNALSVVTLEGEINTITFFSILAHDQQPVPSGVAVDPQTGDVLVALFSGQLWDYYGTILSFMPGDAKIVRVNPATGTYTDEVVGLTTAVDVAMDETGNIYVVEMTTQWATTLLNDQFDLFDPESPPDAGGYARFTGQVTLFPAGDCEPIILADHLDTPTNITYADGSLYVSTGQGTPGRPIWDGDSVTPIVGEIYRISGWDNSCESTD